MTTKSSGEQLSRSSIYRRYKEATRAFCNDLAKLVPFTLVSVSDLAKAADYILNANNSNSSTSTSSNTSSNTKLKQHVKQSLLTPLDESIRLRQAVGATYSLEEQDDGHAYVIQVLQYCRSVLHVIVRTNVPSKQHRRQGYQNMENENPHQPSSIANGVGFELLNIDSDDDSDDDGDDDDATPREEDKHTLKRPPEASKQYSIESDLIEGSLVFRANLFFLNAENLFSIVAEAYGTLQKDLELLESSGKPFAQVNHETVVHILKATATVNLAIKHVRCLEKSFVAGNAPFHSIYHVFGVLVFPDMIKEMESILGPLYVVQFPFHAVNLTAHSIRLGLLGGEAYFESMDSIVEQMVPRKVYKKFGVTEHRLTKLKEVCWTICVSVDLEGSIDPSKLGGDPGRNNVFDVRFVNPVDGTEVRTVGFIDREWLDKYGLLGGRSGILYTFAQIEKAACNFPSEAAYNAARASGDNISLDSTRRVVDTLLRPRLLWQLLRLDHFGLLKLLPCGNKGGTLCTTLFRDFIGFRTKQERGSEFALVFGCHALAYGASVLSVGNHTKRIAVLSKLTLDKFEMRLHELQNTSYVSHLERMKPGLMKALKSLHYVTSLPPEYRGWKQAFWNPLFAGSTLLTLVFHSNMGNGYGTCDLLMQTRFTLHLYNALRQRNMIQAIDVLDKVESALGTNEAVWPTGKPPTGGFLKSFLSANGSSSRLADIYVDFLGIDQVAKKHHLKKLMARSERWLDNRGKHLGATQQNALIRVLHLIDLRSKGGLSKGSSAVRMDTAFRASASYNYAATMQFTSDQTSKPQPSETDEVGAVCSQQSTLVRDAIDSEHEMLSIDWLATGHLLDNFVQEIMEALHLPQLVAEIQPVLISHKYKIILGHDTVYLRNIAGLFLSDMVFRELEFEKATESCVNSQTVATIMKEFFSSQGTMKDIVLF